MIDFKKLAKKYSSSRFSSFWDDTSDTSIVDDFLNDDVEKKKVTRKKDVVQLAGYKRAISNFVNIVTGKNVPVKYITKDSSFTDGRVVTIGANLSDKNFDIAVGLALHEGAHVELTNFNFNPKSNVPEELYVIGENKGYIRNEITKHIFELTNWIEDRRIDKYIISTSPGYKGYYHSMYDKYFHNKNIDSGLISDMFREEMWESYSFRIINLINPKRQFGALKGLKEIWNVLNLKNIDRLKNTEDSFKLACDIYRIVMRNVDKQKVEEKRQLNQQANGSSNNSSNNNDGDEKSQKNDTTVSDEEFNDLMDDVKNGKIGQSDGSDNGGSGIPIDIGDVEIPNSKPIGSSSINDDGNPTKKLSDKQKELLEKAIEKQKDFIEGKTKKTKLTKKYSKDIKAIEKSGATYETVGFDKATYSYGHAGTMKKTKCLVIKKLSKGLIESNQFSFARSINGTYYDDNNSKRNSNNRYNFVEEGIRLGIILGKKLKIRGEEKSTKYTRKNTGKIDKRLISELGFQNENVFSQTFTDKYNKAYLHISIDASGSMDGNKWNEAMTSAVAMIKACDMAGNIDVVVSIRSTDNANYYNTPAIMVCYDSRIDKFNKVKSLFKYLDASGTTPEGLCFEAIIKDLIPGNDNQESYFINYSDGQPYFSNGNIYYGGKNAAYHTKKQVDNMKKMGIRVISYFISDSSWDRRYGEEDFKIMYGADSHFISPVNMIQVAKSMNQKFLSKKN